MEPTEEEKRIARDARERVAKGERLPRLPGMTDDELDMDKVIGDGQPFD